MGHWILVWCRYKNFYHLVEEPCLLCSLFLRGVFDPPTKLAHCLRWSFLFFAPRIVLSKLTYNMIGSSRYYSRWRRHQYEKIQALVDPFEALHYFLRFNLFGFHYYVHFFFTTECSFLRRSAGCFTSRVVCRFLQYSSVNEARKTFF